MNAISKVLPIAAFLYIGMSYAQEPDFRFMGTVILPPSVQNESEDQRLDYIKKKYQTDYHRWCLLNLEDAFFAKVNELSFTRSFNCLGYLAKNDKVALKSFFDASADNCLNVIYEQLRNKPGATIQWKVTDANLSKAVEDAYGPVYKASCLDVETKVNTQLAPHTQPTGVQND